MTTTFEVQAKEVDEDCDYVPRETIEICVNREKDEWVMAVFLGKVKAKENNFEVQILNQDEKMCVDLSSIRKFKGCSDKQMFMNMVTISMGAGIFSMPWALAGSSMIPGLILIFLSMYFVFDNCKEVLESADRHNYDNMGKILEKELEAYPKTAQAVKIIATATCWVSTILCIISYYVIIHDNGKVIGETLFPKFNHNHWYWISPLIASLLTFCPNHMLSWTSVISLVITFFVIIALAIYLGEKGAFPLGGEKGVHIFSIGRGYFIVIANVMMSMAIQYNMPSLYKEVQIRDVKKTTWVMRCAFLTAYAIFSITVILAYFCWGSDIVDNFLTTLGNSATAIFVQACAMLVCLCVAPLCVLPITDDIELWIKFYQLKKNSNTTKNEHDIENSVKSAAGSDDAMENKKSMKMSIFIQILKIFVISFPVGFACLNVDLATVNVWNGITVLFCYCGITPLITAPKLGPKQYILGAFVLIVTIITTVLSILSNGNYHEDLTHCTPYW